MTLMQIRNVPEDDHRELVRAAEERGVPLQQFLVELVRTEAARRRNARLLAEHAAFLRGRNGVGVSAPELDEFLAEGRQVRGDHLAGLVGLAGSPTEGAA